MICEVETYELNFPEMSAYTNENDQNIFFTKKPDIPKNHTEDIPNFFF